MIKLFSGIVLKTCYTMPDYAFGGTVTFDPCLTLEKKNKLIDKFPTALANMLHFSKSNDVVYYLAVSKEYHKVDGESDPEAPHLHFILYSYIPIGRCRVRAIQNLLKTSYGRSQFYLMTTKKTKSYERYIKKEVEYNDKHFGGYHYYEMNLEQPFEDVEHEDLIYWSEDEY